MREAQCCQMSNVICQLCERSELMWFKIIFAGALAIILVVSVLTALFGAGRIVQATLETYILKVESCRYDKPRAVVLEEVSEVVPPQEYEETCFVDYNRAKRDIAQGIAQLFVAGPVGWFMFLQVHRLIGERKKKK